MASAASNPWRNCAAFPTKASSGPSFGSRRATTIRSVRLISLTDCYISLHRSEGFGLTLAEAMSLEKPVIATAYSGNLDFMTPANSCLILAAKNPQV